jgi:hypothetical protein
MAPADITLVRKGIIDGLVKESVGIVVIGWQAWHEVRGEILEPAFESRDYTIGHRCRSMTIGQKRLLSLKSARASSQCRQMYDWSSCWE